MKINDFENVSNLSVVIPVYNEQHTIRQIVLEVLKQQIVSEVIIVDDFSNDGTSKELISIATENSKVRVFTHKKNLGKGAALHTAFKNITGKIVVIQDGDLEYHPQEYYKMWYLIHQNHYDVVYGSRFLNKDKIVKKSIHYYGNKLLTNICNAVTGLKLTDQATCYKMFRSDVLTVLNLKEKKFGFCSEFTSKISNHKFKIGEVPISYNPRTIKEGKKIRFYHGFNALKCIIYYKYISV